MDVSITIPAQTVTIPSQSVSATIPAAEIVYQNTWLTQISAISNSSIFTVSEPGIFRITGAVYSFNKPPDPLPDAGCTVACTLTVPSQGVDMSFTCTSEYGHAVSVSSTQAIVVGDGTSVILNATITDEFGVLDHYDVYVTIEQVQ